MNFYIHFNIHVTYIKLHAYLGIPRTLTAKSLVLAGSPLVGFHSKKSINLNIRFEKISIKNRKLAKSRNACYIH